MRTSQRAMYNVCSKTEKFTISPSLPPPSCANFLNVYFCYCKKKSAYGPGGPSGQCLTPVSVAWFPPPPSILIAGAHFLHLGFLAKETTRWQKPDSNHRPPDWKSNALTTACASACCCRHCGGLSLKHRLLSVPKGEIGNMAWHPIPLWDQSMTSASSVHYIIPI